ncbi:MAG: alpha/beta hydrolase [Pseudoxanthomonas sp.]
MRLARPFRRRRWPWTLLVMALGGTLALLARTWLPGMACAVIMAGCAHAADGEPVKLSTKMGAGAIRFVFDAEAARVRRKLEAHPPAKPVTSLTGLRYLADDETAVLDVHFPQDVADGAKLPVLIWIHGGAWLSGSREDAARYFQHIAAAGYTVVAPDYALAPTHRYPTPVRQLNATLDYLRTHAAELHADVSRIVLAGDSAGAQLAAQLAAAGSNPAYAAELGLQPAFTPEVLRGVILHCGVFDLEAMAALDNDDSRILSWGTNTMVRAYAGTEAASDPVFRQMSIRHHVTARFPPTWISGGNADPLTDAHSRPLAARLRALGVPVTELFYPADHVPKLAHEYQFDLDQEDGRNALASTLDFLRRRFDASATTPTR